MGSIKISELLGQGDFLQAEGMSPTANLPTKALPGVGRGGSVPPSPRSAPKQIHLDENGNLEIENESR